MPTFGAHFRFQTMGTTNSRLLIMQNFEIDISARQTAENVAGGLGHVLEPKSRSGCMKIIMKKSKSRFSKKILFFTKVIFLWILTQNPFPIRGYPCISPPPCFQMVEKQGGEIQICVKTPIKSQNGSKQGGEIQKGGGIHGYPLMVN